MSFLILFSSLLTSSIEERPPFILVELFTSEGCSSCPPADRLLSEIVDSQQEDVEVIGLSFHVDYWDYIGWDDPYAKSAFTQRQRTYARKLYSNQVYTPQMVVNGKYEFVGSNKSRWNRLFDELRNEKSDYVMKIEEVQLLEKAVILSVSSEDVRKVILNVAVVERGLSQNVTRGENKGRKLSHDNVVRSFKTRQFDGQKNQFRLEIPSDLNSKNSNVIVYAQHENNWEVIGATKIAF